MSASGPRLAPPLLLAIGDLADRRVLAVLGRSLIVTLLIFASLGLLAAWALRGVDPCGWIGEDACMLGLGGGTFGAALLTALALWLLFPAVALGVLSGYMDRVVGAVERRHYPRAAEMARPMGVMRGLAFGLGSAVRVIVYNLLAVPLYIALLVTGIGPILLFLLVNGAAFGRDLGTMVAMRHADRRSRRAWFRRSRIERLLIGASMTALFLIPIANLAAPLIGASAMTHLYNRRR